MAKSVLSKKVEEIAKKRAEVIDLMIFEAIPSWQLRLIKFNPLFGRIFGWEIEYRNGGEWDTVIIKHNNKEVSRRIFRIKFVK